MNPSLLKMRQCGMFQTCTDIFNLKVRFLKFDKHVITVKAGQMSDVQKMQYVQCSSSKCKGQSHPTNLKVQYSLWAN